MVGKTASHEVINSGERSGDANYSGKEGDYHEESRRHVSHREVDWEYVSWERQHRRCTNTQI